MAKKARKTSKKATRSTRITAKNHEADMTVPRLSRSLQDVVQSLRSTSSRPAGHAAAQTQKAKRAKEKTIALKGKFKAAHADGMEALNQHDYPRLSNVIAKEAQLLEEQSEILRAQQEDAAALSRAIEATLETGRTAKTNAEKKR